ncbi:pyruvate, water dikinase regulatory protein [Streptococcus sp. HF-2466]|uniref:pyruvate, water dikinase regulatory protein n=1 Tax=Streptococcus sp. HF-2466 TaxID=2785792 RepID=UPI0018A026A1|nr:pyruvate, water dikinase regulatory protein [Streptococcus sp. HF-2466]MBF7050123.1 kinase/pyrophosphorylase [Streptococcus sp. HF-2466]
MKQEITIYAISDSLGGTSQKLLSAVMAQYPDLIFNNSYRFPFINKESELLDILQDAIKDDAVVISTLVDSHLAATAREFSRVNHLSYLDLMNPFFEIIKEKTGTQPIEVPGVLHRLDTEYFNKISAIEFAVKYDDGKNPQGFLESDIVILGVSRTSKTPLSIYLANKGYKVSNLPLIPEVPLPQILDKVDRRRMIGLVCDPDKLAKVRSNRLDALGLTQTTSYTDIEKIYEELDYSKKVFQKYQAHVINMTDKSIEETACIIEEHLKSLSSNKY